LELLQLAGTAAHLISGVALALSLGLALVRLAEIMGQADQGLQQLGQVI
jgi:hypothetical protein